MTVAKSSRNETSKLSYGSVKSMLGLDTFRESIENSYLESTR
jgi:hypothetical protein